MGRASRVLALTVVLALLIGITPAYADAPGVDKKSMYNQQGEVVAAMPNPGTQEQELPNITFPAPYNVYEFAVTCMACHGGTIDPQAGHGGNWAGTSMASAARDPIFRANAQVVNSEVLLALGQEGASNLCFRCHSPNGWYSGRFNPKLAGASDGSAMMHSPLISTDDEGILCEFCHRAIGNVKMGDPNSVSAYKMMNLGDGGLYNWPHTGADYPQGPLAGNPLGDNTMQVNDGMTYNGPYAGSTEPTFASAPMVGTEYTGQTYGVYPENWPSYIKNPVPTGMPTSIGSWEVAYNPDGTTGTHFEEPADVPRNGLGQKDYMAQAISIEHPTISNGFIQSSEFCGTCHDLTVPFGTGMPEQRTYTEWKYSSFGDEQSANYATCQNCHMPRMKHEYSDAATLTLNPDPTLAGYFPYGKDRSGNGGTAFHKFAGANRELPDMMKILYPEVDLEVIGAPTGWDTRIFPGMMSDRTLTWDRAQRNTESQLNKAVSTTISQPPTYNSQTHRWTMKVQVTNNTGHRIPSGYPDGRRMYLSVNVKDAQNATVYQSGVWDADTAYLKTDADTAFNRATTTTVDASDNRVVTYEKITGVEIGDSGVYEESESLLNSAILFDSRIPPAGFDLTAYRSAGAKFMNYEEVTSPEIGVVPFEQSDRFTSNVDEITYVFDAPADAQLTANAAVKVQTHTREFMEHLKDNQPAQGPRPEGPPNLYAANYPLTPTYLSDSFGKTTGTPFNEMTDLAGQPLSDDWGGIAYAAWLKTGKGEPYTAAKDSTDALGTPGVPQNAIASRATDLPLDRRPFALRVNWDPVEGADKYELQIRYGTSDQWADWDTLKVLEATPTPEFLNEGLNVPKTYAYRVRAINGAGASAWSDVAIQSTPTDIPLNPVSTRFVGPAATSITISWFDQADNEDGFIVQRQTAPPTPQDNAWVEVARVPAKAGTGGVTWTDSPLPSGVQYNYRVAAYNIAGISTFDVPVMGWTIAPPGPVTTVNVTPNSATSMNVSWSGATGNITNYRVERSTDGVNYTFLKNAGTATTLTDTTVTANRRYWYRVWAYNMTVPAASAGVGSGYTPAVPPTAPTGLGSAQITGPAIDLTWTDASANEDGFVVQRSTNGGSTWSTLGTVAANVKTYRDSSVTAGSTYQYRVYSYIDQLSPSLRVLSATPAGPITVTVTGAVPAAPDRPTATALTSSILIGWRDRSSNETGFKIYRSTNSTTGFVMIGTAAANASSYTDRSGLVNGTTYYYKITAYNASGESAPTSVVSARSRVTTAAVRRIGVRSLFDWIQRSLAR